MKDTIVLLERAYVTQHVRINDACFTQSSHIESGRKFVEGNMVNVNTRFNFVDKFKILQNFGPQKVKKRRLYTSWIGLISLLLYMI